MTHAEIVKKVQWKDLRALSVREMLIENNLTIPWFVISLTLAYYGYYLFCFTLLCFLLLNSFATGTQWLSQLSWY